MTQGKRVFDIALALLLSAVLLIPGLVIAGLVLALSGRPVTQATL